MKVILLILLTLVVAWVSSCAPENVDDKYDQVKAEFYKNEKLFEEIATRVRNDDYPILYLSPTSVKLANTLKARKTSEETIQWYREKMAKANVEIALQMNTNGGVVSFAMWSQGIVTGGVGIEITTSPQSIYERAYYIRRKEKGTVSCETLKEDWYICVNY